MAANAVATAAGHHLFELSLPRTSVKASQTLLHHIISRKEHRPAPLPLLPYSPTEARTLPPSFLPSRCLVSYGARLTGEVYTEQLVNMSD